MTPAARVAAAIDILDRYLSGEAAEKALTTWARGNRFAGSKDRAAIRDHVFDAIRNRRLFAALGGAETGRGLMIGSVRKAGADLAQIFSGQGYGPASLTELEAAFRPPKVEDLAAPIRLNYPDWLELQLAASLGDDLERVMQVLGNRAPVFLRANLLKGGRDAAAAALREDGVVTEPHPLAETALLVTENTRRIRQSRAYLEGVVELQDAASQAIVAELGAGKGKALDYCAGGGGKALSLAAAGWTVTAHDAFDARMNDIPARAARAGVQIDQATTKALQRTALFDLVVVDAPCSGSGAWRRQPEARWRLTPERLTHLQALQSEIVDKAARHVRPGGRLAYITCSLLDAENQRQTARFAAEHPEWSMLSQRCVSPLDGGDGFYVSIHEWSA